MDLIDQTQNIKLSQARKTIIVCNCGKTYFNKQAYSQHVKNKHSEEEKYELHKKSKMPQDIRNSLLKQCRHKNIATHQKEHKLLNSSLEICKLISQEIGTQYLLTQDQIDLSTVNNSQDFDQNDNMIAWQHFQQQKINKQVRQMLQSRYLTQIFKSKSYEIFNQICYVQQGSKNFKFHICYDISKRFKFEYAWKIELTIIVLALQKLVDQSLKEILRQAINHYQAKGQIIMLSTLSKYVNNFFKARKQLKR